MSRDIALIILAGVIAVVGIICGTLMVLIGDADPQYAFGLLTAVVSGIAGVAIGRLTGKPLGS